MMTFMILLAVAGFLVIRLVIKYLQKKNVDLKHNIKNKLVIGLFHPYCNAGGGGERVLWCSVRAILSRHPDSYIVIYTGDHLPPNEIIENARMRFNIELPNHIHFVFLTRRSWVEASRYPRFTLLGQSLGSVILGIEALFKLVPDVFIDTMGYAFTYPIFRYLGGCMIGCYIHYPTISSDMLNRVMLGTTSFNNDSFITQSPFLTWSKSVYYKLFALIYGIVGRCSHIAMVNSSWTEDHINKIWKIPERTLKVYPPCDVQEFLTIPIELKSDKIWIIAVAQFRPEKDHPLMIRSYYRLIDKLSEEEKKQVKLIFVGSCRNDEDHKRVDDYKRLCKHFNIDERVEFHINVEFNQLKLLISQSTIGLHSMWNEHFGIGIVECMAAGLVMVANHSGGPLMDIIIQKQGWNTRIGFLASDETEYVEALLSIIRMDPEERVQIRRAAKNSVSRFSDEAYEAEFLTALSALLHDKRVL